MESSRGRLITFEGLNGCGKTTLIKNIKEILEKSGNDKVSAYKCPGDGVPEVRSLIKSSDIKFCAKTYMFLSCADIMELMRSKIIPDLSNGYTVLVDRMEDSLIAYQCFLGNVEMSFAKQCIDFATSHIHPDLTFFLDISFDVSENRRSRDVQKDEFELDMKFNFDRIRDGFIHSYLSNPSRVKRINGEKSIESIVEECMYHIV